MNTHRSLAAIAASGLALLVPSLAFAASASTSSAAAVTEEDILNAISDPAPVMSEGKGGGYGSIYPGPMGGGVTVDSNYTKEVTPDFIALNAYCEVTGESSRQIVRDALNKMFTEIKTSVGSDGRVRKSGMGSIYPYYDPVRGGQTDQYSGSLSVFIRITNLNAAQRISDMVEDKGCSPSWDVRLVDTQKYELDNLDTLIKRLNDRKVVFEKLLGRKLTQVIGASLYTYVDGYGTYDPETNTVDATTTLSVTFDIGTRASITPAPSKRSSVTPRG